MYEYVHLSVGVHGAEARGMDTPGGGVIGSCGLVEVVSRNRTQVLFKTTVFLNQ